MLLLQSNLFVLGGDMKGYPVKQVSAILAKYGYVRETEVGKEDMLSENRHYETRGYRHPVTKNSVSLDLTFGMHPLVTAVLGWGQNDPVFKELEALGWNHVHYPSPVEEKRLLQRWLRKFRGQPVVDRGFVFMRL